MASIITKNNLKIISINVNSIITNERRASLLEFLQTHNPDIALIGETKLNNSHKLNFKNYNMVRNDRKNAKQAGGTAILIKKDIQFKRIAKEFTGSDICLEKTVIEIKVKNYGPGPSIIKKDLLDLFLKIQDYLHTWKLKINTTKCETILFRPYISNISDGNSDTRQNSQYVYLVDNNINQKKIPHKKIVRYLGVHLDFKLNYAAHIRTQIQKAQNAFLLHKRLFYDKNLNNNVKILMYKLLIRPILTYGCQI